MGKKDGGELVRIDRKMQTLLYKNGMVLCKNTDKYIKKQT